MHKFLRSIGFSNITNKQLEQMLKIISEKPDVVRTTRDSEGNEFAELYKEVANNMGVVIRGIYDENDVFQIDYYFPILYGTSLSTREEIDIQKHAEKESYAGVCDDNHLGVTLIFYLQNVADYLAEKFMKKDRIYPNGAILSGLSVEGKILLPVKDTTKTKASNSNGKERSQLVAEAREGSEEAIENLTMDDMDTYNMISERLLKEDLFSIVSTSFMPYGIESDQYTVLGTIKDFSIRRNKYTDEDIYVLNLECNDVLFDVCINRLDLLGEPAIGRRFKGNIWMQGSVDLE